METLAAILILTPIFLPIIQTLGMNPIHFGVMMIVNLAIGFVTPPIGMNLYVASSMTGIPVLSIAKKAVPFMVAFFVALMFLTFIPEISLLLIKR
jgi:C4-dicarboxylate transporter DctM subunit